MFCGLDDAFYSLSVKACHNFQIGQKRAFLDILYLSLGDTLTLIDSGFDFEIVCQRVLIRVTRKLTDMFWT